MTALAEKTRSLFIQHGVSRANRFQVTIPLPKLVESALKGAEGGSGILPDWLSKTINIAGILAGNPGHSTRAIQFMCRSTEVPGFQFETTTAKMMGHTTTVANMLDREQISFGFQLSMDAFERKVFDEWKNVVVDEKASTAGYYDDYSVDIQIDMLDLQDQVVYTCYLLGAFPVTVAPVGLNKMSSDMANGFDTVWNYTRVSSEKESSKTSSSGLPGSIGGIVDGIMNGDLESAAYSARQLITEAQSGNFTGEALAMVGKINEVVKETTGFSATEMSKTVKGLKKMVNTSTKVESGAKSSIHKMLDGLL